MIALRWAMRCTPIASVTVMSAGNPFWDHRHCDADDRLEYVHEGHATNPPAVSEHDDDDDPNDSGDRITEFLDLTEKWCFDRTDRSHHLVDAAQFGFRAGRDHYSGSAPGRDQCSGERHAFPITNRSFVGHRVCGLIDGHRLASEGRFFCSQVLDLDETKVCRDLVARFKEHDVAWYQFFGRDQTNLSAAQGSGLRRQHVADRVERLLGLAFLNEAKQRIENNDTQNDCRVEP